MSNPQRFSRGVTNVSNSNSFGQLGMLDPTKYSVFFDDFHKFNPGDWVVQRSETPTSNTVLATTVTDSYEEISDARHGILSVVTALDDDAYAFFQRGQDAFGGTFGETFTLLSGKKTWFKARFKADDVDTCSLKFGLVVMDTSDPIETVNSDGLWFYSADGSANLDFYTYASSASVIGDTAIATLADDTYLDVAFYHTGGGTIEYYVNEAMVGTANVSFPTAELSPSFGIMNGSAAVSTLSVDYICAIEER